MMAYNLGTNYSLERLNLAILYEEIEINEEIEPYRMRVRYTRHGPVMTDLKSWDRLNNFFILPKTRSEFPENMGFTVLALRWTALEPGTLQQAILELDRARNFEEFREALRQWDIPGQNIVYADVDGNIGYQCPGLYPLRARGSGLAPVPGWSDEYEWQGFVPFEQLPYVYNPPKGQSRFKNAFFYLFKEPDNLFWDARGTPDKRETRDDILVEAFRKGYRAAVDRLGDKMDKWKWGKVHRSEFRNATFGSSGIAAIEKIFNRGPGAGSNTTPAIGDGRLWKRLPAAGSFFSRRQRCRSVVETALKRKTIASSGEHRAHKIPFRS